MTWDDAKRLSNLAKHHIDFEDVRDFDWARSVVVVDARSNYGELRKVAYGFLRARLHVLVFTERSGTGIHVISLRKANDRERRRYAVSVKK